MSAGCLATRCIDATLLEATYSFLVDLDERQRQLRISSKFEYRFTNARKAPGAIWWRIVRSIISCCILPTLLDTCAGSLRRL